MNTKLKNKTIKKQLSVTQIILRYIAITFNTFLLPWFFITLSMIPLLIVSILHIHGYQINFLSNINPFSRLDFLNWIGFASIYSMIGAWISGGILTYKLTPTHKPLVTTISIFISVFYILFILEYGF